MTTVNSPVTNIRNKLDTSIHSINNVQYRPNVPSTATVPTLFVINNNTPLSGAVLRILSNRVIFDLTNGYPAGRSTVNFYTIDDNKNFYCNITTGSTNRGITVQFYRTDQTGPIATQVINNGEAYSIVKTINPLGPSQMYIITPISKQPF